ncbi:MAG: ATP-binding protein [Saprospiraceae bacterium]
MIPRLLQSSIYNAINNDKKIVILYGPRQVGKTTLINSLIEKLNIKTIKANGDELIYHDVFSTRDLKKMLDFIDDNELLFIDEAQNISEIGINLKILHDNNPQLKIIVSGSSSLDLADKIKEPLTGRSISYLLYPVSISEERQYRSKFDISQNLSDYLTFGMYPEIVSIESRQKKITRLKELASSYLYKDILVLSNIKNSDKIFKLLQLLAYQIGQPVSINELSNSLGLSSETVNYYIDLLEKSFVVYRLSALSNNPRKEISKMSKIFFYDIGIRNTLIDSFQDIEMRNDKGQIFENFIINERIKRNAYLEDYARYYYWRTYGGAEIDFIESKDDRYFAYEIKYRSKKIREPLSWSANYVNSEFKIINPDNFLEYVLI